MAWNRILKLAGSVAFHSYLHLYSRSVLGNKAKLISNQSVLNAEWFVCNHSISLPRPTEWYISVTASSTSQHNNHRKWKNSMKMKMRQKGKTINMLMLCLRCECEVDVYILLFNNICMKNASLLLRRRRRRRNRKMRCDENKSKVDSTSVWALVNAERWLRFNR